MAHFTLTRPVWVSFTDLYASEMSTIDLKIFKSVNGDEGGVWAPSSPIVIGGSGATIKLVGSNDLSSGASLDAASGSTINLAAGAQFSCFGDALYFGSTYILSGAWSFSSGTHTTFDSGSFLNVNGTAAFTGTVTSEFIGVKSVQVAESLYTAPDSVTNLSGTLAVSDRSTFYGDTYHNGTNNFSGPSLVSNTIRLSGIGRQIKEAAFTPTFGSGTISPNTATTWVGNNLTSDVIITIANDGLDGDDLFICNLTNLYALIVKNPSGTIITQLRNQSGLKQAAFIKKIAGTWYTLTEVDS